MTTGSTLARWPQLAAHAPVATATMSRYLGQIAVSLTAASVATNDTSLRTFGTFLLVEHPTVVAVAQLERSHLEDYKRWLASDDDRVPLSATTRSMRLGALRMFFHRAIEWGWDDAPVRPLLFLGDLPRRDQPLPKALDDTDAARFLRTAQEQDRLLARVVTEVLLRTGLRVGELCRLEADAIRSGVDGFWLHVPVGKLHDDRYIPLHPTLVGLIGDYRDRHVTTNHPLLIPHESGRPLTNSSVARMLRKIANRAGVGHVHPHRLRHTLATQAINRGMSMEAIAALLGHHSLDMTRRYARIADRTVATAYFDVADKVDALYGNHLPAPPLTELHREMNNRLLGNGYCTRPRQLDCDHDSACENCVYFQTTIAFRPTLQAQRDDAAAKNQTERHRVFSTLLDRVDHDAAS